MERLASRYAAFLLRPARNARAEINFLVSVACPDRERERERERGGNGGTKGREGPKTSIIASNRNDGGRKLDID